MDVVSKLNAEVGSIGVHLSGQHSDLLIDLAAKPIGGSGEYTAIITKPDIGSVTVSLLSDNMSRAKCTIYENGKNSKLRVIGYGFNIHLDYYRVLLEKDSSALNLQGTDAYGSLSWDEDGCEIIIDLSDDRICPDDATDLIKLKLIGLMAVQSMISTEALAMRCSVYKKYYDSLPS